MAHTLKGWRTIQEIREALGGVLYDPIRRLAVTHKNEAWVKKCGHPRHWLINTDHPQYQKLISELFPSPARELPFDFPEELPDPTFATLDEDDEEELPDLTFATFPEDDEEEIQMLVNDIFGVRSSDVNEPACDSPSSVAPFSHPAEEAPVLDIIAAWPQLCSWLNEQGVSIFFNALSEKGIPQWQWKWGEVAGTGCPDIASAILSALKAKVASLQMCVQEKQYEEVAVQSAARKKWW